MKVEYVEPFVQAACSVLEQVVGGSVKQGHLGLLGTLYPAASINIATHVSGSLNGDLVFSMSSPTARRIAELITGKPENSFSRMTGTGLAQFGGMLTEQTGRILEERGFKCMISGPTVFRGLSIEFSSLAPALVMPVETEAGRVDVNVAVKNGEPS